MTLLRSSFISKAFFLSVLSLLVMLHVQGQEVVEQDTLQIDLSQQANIESAGQEAIVVVDTIYQKKFISGVELAIDYGKLLTLWTKFESKLEGGLNIRFKERIVLASEFGYAELDPLKAYDNALYYTVRGPYARLGLDYYTSYDPKSFYYFGLRYGMSVFEDEGKFLIDSDFWEDYGEEFGSTDITAAWWEIVVGTETYLNFLKKDPNSPKSRLLLGWKFRLRVLSDFENREEPTIYAIPGYGRTFDKTVPVLNLYVKYRFGN